MKTINLLTNLRYKGMIELIKDFPEELRDTVKIQVKFTPEVWQYLSKRKDFLFLLGNSASDSDFENYKHFHKIVTKLYGKYNEIVATQEKVEELEASYQKRIESLNQRQEKAAQYYHEVFNKVEHNLDKPDKLENFDTHSDFNISHLEKLKGFYVYKNELLESIKEDYDKRRAEITREHNEIVNAIFSEIAKAQDLVDELCLSFFENIYVKGYEVHKENDSISFYLNGKFVMCYQL